MMTMTMMMVMMIGCDDDRGGLVRAYFEVGFSGVDKEA
jgi:hypothetical protein